MKNYLKKLASNVISGTVAGFVACYGMYHNPLNVDDESNIVGSAAAGAATFGLLKSATDELFNVEKNRNAMPIIDGSEMEDYDCNDVVFEDEEE